MNLLLSYPNGISKRATSPQNLHKLNKFFFYPLNTLCFYLFSHTQHITNLKSINFIGVQGERPHPDCHGHYLGLPLWTGCEQGIWLTALGETSLAVIRSDFSICIFLLGSPKDILKQRKEDVDFHGKCYVCEKRCNRKVDFAKLSRLKNSESLHFPWVWISGFNIH